MSNKMEAFNQIREKSALKLKTSIQCIVRFILIFAVLHNGFSQSEIEKIDHLIHPIIDNDLFHGSVLVAKEGEVIYNRSFGYANLEWKIPAGPDTKYRIASISKQFTSLMILQLAAEGKIDLNGKITDYLPSYRRDTGDRVSIHQLLTHTSGIPNGVRTPNGFWSNSEHTLIHYSKKEFIEKFCSEDFEFKPGTQFKYSSVGYIILGAVIEEICGKPFPDVFDERIAKRIGLDHSVCDDNLSLVTNRASGYLKDIFEWKNSKYHDMPILDGAGSILTTAEDLFKYDQALYTEELLPNEYLDLFFKPNRLFDDDDYYDGGSYSYGWRISYLHPDTADSVKIISHGGGIRGGSGFYARQIDKKNTVIILSNTEIGSRALRQIGEDILRVINGFDQLNSYEVPIKYMLGKAILDDGIDAAKKKYLDIKRKGKEQYDISGNQLNSLGYDLLQKGRINDALEIFKLNVEANPDYANGYDSLAEVYMKNGQKNLAIKYYEKALESNPDNKNARDMLIRLKK